MVDHFKRERNYERIRYVASPRNQRNHEATGNWGKREAPQTPKTRTKRKPLGEPMQSAPFFYFFNPRLTTLLFATRWIFGTAFPETFIVVVMLARPDSTGWPFSNRFYAI